METHNLPFELPSLEGFSVISRGENAWRINVPGGALLYVENVFPDKIAERSVAFLSETIDGNTSHDIATLKNDVNQFHFKNIAWKQDHAKFFSNEVALPRLTSWYGDAGRDYQYSGIKNTPNPWNKGLLYMKEQVELYAKTQFNSVLLNWYRDGQDSINWHSDNEPELGVNPIIASLSFGETREFYLRHAMDHGIKFVVPLKHNTLLVMGGALQTNWQHTVPKRSSIKGSRFNLTFRDIK